MSDAQSSAPVRGRPFPRGASGNPGGRPRGIRALRERLAEHSEVIEKTLIDALSDEDPRVRLEAVKLAFSYLYGKPDGDGAGSLTDEELLEECLRRIKQNEKLKQEQDQLVKQNTQETK